MLSSSTPRVLGQRYRLGELLGEGASGSVYAALDLMLGRSIAVKCMKLPHEGGLTLRPDDFVSEAQTRAQLKHPHIVDIHDVGIDDEGRPYFVMELVEQSLRDVLKRRTVFEIEELLALLLPLCGALVCAHDLGIVHCDLKPENIAANRLGTGAFRGKVLDFSIAKYGPSSPAKEVVIGTPGYMAPEQIRGDTCGPATDVWALATVAVECLIGRLPFEADSATQLLRRTVFQPPPSVLRLAPKLPIPLALVLDRALAVSPERRYPDMRAFAKALVLAAIQAGVRVPDDPDAIGLSDIADWRAGARLEATAPRKIDAVRMIDAVRRDEVASDAASAGVSQGQPTGAPVRHKRRRVVLLTMGVGFGLVALWGGERALTAERDASAARRALGVRADTGVPRLPVVASSLAVLPPQAVVPVGADLRARADEPGAADLRLHAQGPRASTTLPDAATPSLGSRADESERAEAPRANTPIGDPSHEARQRRRAKREQTKPAPRSPDEVGALHEPPEPQRVPGKDALELKRNWEW